MIGYDPQGTESFDILSTGNYFSLKCAFNFQIYVIVCKKRC